MGGENCGGTCFFKGKHNPVSPTVPGKPAPHSATAMKILPPRAYGQALMTTRAKTLSLTRCQGATNGWLHANSALRLLPRLALGGRTRGVGCNRDGEDAVHSQAFSVRAAHGGRCCLAVARPRRPRLQSPPSHPCRFHRVYCECTVSSRLQCLDHFGSSVHRLKRGQESPMSAQVHAGLRLPVLVRASPRLPPSPSSLPSTPLVRQQTRNEIGRGAPSRSDELPRAGYRHGEAFGPANCPRPQATKDAGRDCPALV